MKCNECEWSGIMVMCDVCPRGVHSTEVPKGMKIKEDKNDEGTSNDTH